MIGLIDDTSGSTNDFLLPTAQSLEHYISHAIVDAEHWNDILCVSGSVLEVSMCSFHYLYYTFTPPGLPVLLRGTMKPTITIVFKNQRNKPL